MGSKIRINEKAEEVEFQRYFKKVWSINNIYLEETEKTLKNPYDLLTRDFRDGEDFSLRKITSKKLIGRIDIVCRFRGVRYAGEIKYFSSRNDFWHSTKIIAYTAYLNWQNETEGVIGKVKPAIFIPKHHVRLEHKIISNKIGVKLFQIIKKENGTYWIEYEN
jgi:hypothetical protein